MSSNNYNYPEITKGMGELTPSMWARLMDALRYHEEIIGSRSADLQPESLSSRITELELHRPFFFAKLLRAHVLDHELYNPNVYEYAWVEVRPVSRPTDCCEGCLTSRNGCGGGDPSECLPVAIIPCCEGPFAGDCMTYLNYQGLWNWWEYTTNTSWGETLARSPLPNQFVPYDLTSDYNPLQYPCIASNLAAPNCNPDYNPVVGEPNYPDRNHIAYTNPAMNILEAFNTADNAGGVDQRDGVGDFMMQAIGGGDTVRMDTLGFTDSYALGIPECHPDAPPHDPPLDHPPCTQYEFALKSTPIVLMHNIRESDGTYRQVFQEANSYDGTCVNC
mgnify:CR=1 FL=1